MVTFKAFLNIPLFEEPFVAVINCLDKWPSSPKCACFLIIKNNICLRFRISWHANPYLVKKLLRGNTDIFGNSKYDVKCFILRGSHIYGFMQLAVDCACLYFKLTMEICKRVERKKIKKYQNYSLFLFFVNNI